MVEPSVSSVEPREDLRESNEGFLPMEECRLRDRSGLLAGTGGEGLVVASEARLTAGEGGWMERPGDLRSCREDE